MVELRGEGAEESPLDRSAIDFQLPRADKLAMIRCGHAATVSALAESGRAPAAPNESDEEAWFARFEREAVLAEEASASPERVVAVT